MYKQILEKGEKTIVHSIAGNKYDLYENEALRENEAKEFTDKIGAIFELNSAANNTGITELFKDVWSKYLEPNFQQIIKNVEDDKINEGKGTNVVLDNQEEKNKEKAKKKGFF